MLCPYCREEIQDRAVICRHCGRRIKRRTGWIVAALLLAALLLGGLAAWKPLTRAIDGFRFLAANRDTLAGKDRESPGGKMPAGEKAIRYLEPDGATGDGESARENASEPPPGGLSLDQVLVSIFRVESSAGVGSGFFISSKGDALTSAHVVGGDRTVQIHLTDGTRRYATVDAKDLDGDIALLKIPTYRPYYVVPLGDATLLKAGGEVTVAGFPLGLETAVVTRGIVSAAPMYLPGITTPVIQIDASINPGNSGGPLLDRSGKAVGIVAAKLYGAESMNWVVPINYIAHLDVLKPPTRIRFDNDRFKLWKSTAELKALELRDAPGSRSHVGNRPPGTGSGDRPRSYRSRSGTPSGRNYRSSRPSRNTGAVRRADPETIRIEKVRKTTDGIILFLTLRTENDVPTYTDTTVQLKARWSDQVCATFEQVLPEHFRGATSITSKVRGKEQEVWYYLALELRCTRLPARGDVWVYASFSGSDHQAKYHWKR